MRRVITLAAVGVVAAATTGMVATSALADSSAGPGPSAQVSTTWQGPDGNGPGNGPGDMRGNGYGPGDGTCTATCDGTPDRAQARDRAQTRDLTANRDQVRDRLHDGSCLATS